MSQKASPIRPLSSTPDHYIPYPSPPSNIPPLNPKPQPPTPLMTEETSVFLQKSELESLSRTLIEQKLFKIPCQRHENRFLDQICKKEACEYQGERRLFCGKCLITDENHVKSHRGDIIDLNTYIIYKMDEIEGKSFEKELFNSMKVLNELKKGVFERVNKAIGDIERDFKGLIRDLTAFLDEIMHDLERKLMDFQEGVLKEINGKEAILKRKNIQFSTEQAYVFKDLDRFLEIINVEKESQINDFFKNLMRQKPKFSIEKDYSLIKLKLDSLKGQLQGCKLYNSAYVMELKEKVLAEIHLSHYKENFLLDLPNLISIPLDFGNKINNIKENMIENYYFEYRSSNPIKSIELSYKTLLNSEHYMGINTIEIDQKQKLLITCSNDKTIKLWLFNEKPLFILLDTLLLPNLTLSMKLFPLKNMLFVASGVDVLYYDLNLQSKKNLLIYKGSLKGHCKQIKALVIYEEIEILVSLGENLKFWSITKGFSLKTIELSKEYRLMVKGEGGLLGLGNFNGVLAITKVIMGLNGIIIEDFKEIEVFKEGISAISFLSNEKVIVGSKKGRVKGFNLGDYKKYVDIKDINKGSLIYGLLPIYSSIERSFMMVFSWGGEISVWELKEMKKTGSYKHNLKSNIEKHVNYQGTSFFKKGNWVFTSGNEDKEIEIIEIAINEI